MQSHVLATRQPTAPLMLHALAENWWLILLRGVAAILFEILAYVWPGLTLLVLISLYGAFALVDGVIAVIAAIKGGAPWPRWWLAAVGIAGIVAGVLTFLWPGVTALVLLVFIATWAILTGALQIVGAIRLREEIDNEWWLVAAGALSVLFGGALLVQPGAGALALVWLIGTYTILYGILLIAFALRLRKHGHHRPGHQ